MDQKFFSFEALMDVVRQEVEHFGHLNIEETQGTIDSDVALEFISSLKENLDQFFNAQFFTEVDTSSDDIDEDDFMLLDDEDDLDEDDY